MGINQRNPKNDHYISKLDPKHIALSLSLSYNNIPPLYSCQDQIEQKHLVLHMLAYQRMNVCFARPILDLHQKHE